MVGLIVHEWISRHGGSENVAEAMAKTFPDAELLCLWNDAPERFAGTRVRESWIARTPLRRSKTAALPFMPRTWARTEVSAYDFVLVSSHLFAHQVGGRFSADGPAKYVYVHTPARYIWAPELDSRGRNPLARLAAPFYRRLDASRTGAATYAANSHFVKERIRATWDQDATVIPPPVDVKRIQSVSHWSDSLNPGDEKILAGLPKQFILGASRFVSYKRLDVVISAGEATGLPVVLAGAGPQRAELLAAAEGASVPVYFVDRPSNELLYALYQAALVFVFPPIEDFGIMPVEAMSLGTPTLVYSIGGAQESVSALSGGAIIDGFSKDQLRRGIEDALKSNMSEAQALANNVFGEDAFMTRLRDWMPTADDGHHSTGRLDASR